MNRKTFVTTLRAAAKANPGQLFSPVAVNDVNWSLGTLPSSSGAWRDRAQRPGQEQGLRATGEAGEHRPGVRQP
jgi:hypothetical protein